jgi:hypothetical protein
MEPHILDSFTIGTLPPAPSVMKSVNSHDYSSDTVENSTAGNTSDGQSAASSHKEFLPVPEEKNRSASNLTRKSSLEGTSSLATTPVGKVSKSNLAKDEPVQQTKITSGPLSESPKKAELNTGTETTYYATGEIPSFR